MFIERDMIKLSVYLPNNIMDNDDFSNMFPDWNSDRVFEQTGIRSRHYSADDEKSSDMACAAIDNLAREHNIDKNSVDFLICVTETPDNMLPATAFKIHRLSGLPKTCGAFDINHGCAGFAYGLFTAKSMIMSGMASNIIVVTSDILSKYCSADDRGIKTLIGDGASACLIDRAAAESMGEFIYGSDGSGYEDIIIKKDDSGSPALYMNGMNVFYFAISEVPAIIDEILAKNNMVLDDIDHIVLHQANKTILEYIRKRLKAGSDRFFINMETTGNTASSTIPLALDALAKGGRLEKGMKILILGFGVGLSWCGTIIEW
ncbi:MAG: ketoacyl-ACP synthase III [Mucispirillum sp.]|nr:ketoacyl-ACP synthase III [Mucispirillum sp.]